MSIDQQAPAGGFTMALTGRAAEEVQKFIAQEQVPADTAGLRVSVLPGGCSGFKYSLNIEERALDDDMVHEINGVRVFVDGFSAQYLAGITIDYVTLHAGFGVHVQQPQRDRRLRVRQQLYRLSQRISRVTLSAVKGAYR